MSTGRIMMQPFAGLQRVIRTWPRLTLMRLKSWHPWHPYKENDMPEKIQKIPCAAPGCGKEISYKRETIPALCAADPQREAAGAKDVYLTCPAGHTLRYEIKVE